ncbi:MAG: hypothetical protein IOB85_15260 [Methylobacterium sp.]|nr:hypothetical protein [Methylobacterium sp.]MCA3668618.1 hypothetical protein [Methylobacterium sp.]MCA3673185.1 hypothetical protein [Methylobacterium sp.]MCA3675531.1 hypothetical protein [Methylobacterium sp.]MCA3682290.1 hypothetical protein [Methylobacterium sp.]
MSAQIIRLSDLKTINDEPRILDLKLGEALGFVDLHKVRDLIKRNLDELRRHGEVSATVAETSAKGGRPSMEYLLNQAQALLVAMFSRTPLAADVREMLIRVFMEYERIQRGEASPILPQRMQDEPLQSLRVKIDMVKEARNLFGPHRAKALWSHLGLPAMPDAPPPREDEPVAALALLLDTALPPDGLDDTGMGDLRARIERAFDSEEARLSLLPLGIRIYDDPEGFVVSNTSPFIISAFEGTEWQWRRWQRTLRRLPGAHAAKSRFGDISSRGTFIPADLLDVRPPS